MDLNFNNNNSNESNESSVEEIMGYIFVISKSKHLVRYFADLN